MKQIKLKSIEDYSRLRKGDWLLMKHPEDKDWIIVVYGFNVESGVLKHRVVSLFDFHSPLMAIDVESFKMGQVKEINCNIADIRTQDFKVYLLNRGERKAYQKKIMAMCL